MNITKTIFTGALLTATAMGFADTEKTVPTGWWWLENASEASVNEQVDAGYRLIDIEINDTSPYRFAATYVRNAGEYEKDWGWRFNRTQAQLDNYISANNLRPIDLEVSRVNGQIRFAAVLIRNTGADQAQWDYVFDQSIESIDSRIEATGERLVDLDSYVVNGQRLWSAVFVSNTGNQFRNWWWYSNLHANDINGKLALHNAYVVDVEPRGNNRYSVVLQQRPRTGSTWYAPGLTESGLRAFYRQRKARIIDLERVSTGGNTLYFASLIDNANDTERRVRDMALGQTDGTFGFYFRRMNGGTRAEINGNYVIYPASTIKILELVYSMSQEGLANPQVPLWPNSTSDFQMTPPFPPTESLSTMQTQMMVNSNNQRTNCIQDFYGEIPFNGFTFYFGAVGRTLMNQYGWNVVGMSNNTGLFHKLGAGGPANNPANRATLIDLGILYEKFGQGQLLSPAVNLAAYSRMLWNRGPNNNHGFFSAINTVANQEGTDAGLTGNTLSQFRNAIHVIMKPGSFSTGSNIQYASIAGMIYLPFKEGKVVTLRGYVFGSFADQYTFANFSVASNGTPQITTEMMREEIRAAAASFL